jgi:hypothetical protein
MRSFGAGLGNVGTKVERQNIACGPMLELASVAPILTHGNKRSEEEHARLYMS